MGKFVPTNMETIDIKKELSCCEVMNGLVQSDQYDFIDLTQPRGTYSIIR